MAVLVGTALNQQAHHIQLTPTLTCDEDIARLLFALSLSEPISISKHTGDRCELRRTGIAPSFLAMSLSAPLSISKYTTMSK